jgi:hypothetical protein
MSILHRDLLASKVDPQKSPVNCKAARLYQTRTDQFAAMRVLGNGLLRRFIPGSAFLSMPKLESQRIDFVIGDDFKI